MLSWALVAALQLTSVQLVVGLRNENRVGFIPLVTTINGVQGQSLGTATTLSTELSPTLALRLLGNRSELRLSYTPQFLLTNAFGNTNALTLHNAQLSAGYRLTRFTTVYANGNVTAGQIDFYRARRLLNPEQATIFTIPENRILSYASAQAFVGLTQQFGRFTRVDFQGLTGHTGPAPGQQSFQFFRKQDFVGGSAKVTRLLDVRNSIAAEAEYREIWFDGGPYYNAITPALSYDYRSDRQVNINVRAGVQFSGTQYGSRQIPEWMVGGGLLPPRTGTEERMMPVMSLVVGGIAWRGAGYMYSTRFSLNLLPFYDPVQGVLQQRIAFGVGNNIVLSRLYLARIDFSVYIPGDFEFTSTNQPYIDQDVFAILNPVLIRTLSRTARVELGALITERLEDYTEVVGHWNRPEVILYLAFHGATPVW
ncbi:MAG: hypothetical protein ACAI38_03930 [Myxococcota bacterium]|nr:hypothetical protein [Myxococcota bacterium]